MDFKDLAAERYSCRSMSNRKVDDALVEQIIATAIKAPTAVNRQPVKIFWMKSEKAKKNIHQVTSCTFNADTFLVVGYQEDGAWVRPFDDRNFADIDAGIVATHIMMEVADLGLATTWVGYFDAPLLQSLYPEMQAYDLVAIFPIGYAAEDGEPSPRHAVRKSRAEMVQEL